MLASILDFIVREVQSTGAGMVFPLSLLDSSDGSNFDVYGCRRNRENRESIRYVHRHWKRGMEDFTKGTGVLVKIFVINSWLTKRIPPLLMVVCGNPVNPMGSVACQWVLWAVQCMQRRLFQASLQQKLPSNFSCQRFNFLWAVPVANRS